MVLKNPWKLQSINEKIILKHNECHIWKTTVFANVDNLDSYWYLLTQDERVRAKEYYFAVDRNRYIIARAILRKLIAMYLDITPQDILFGYTEYGKPYLDIKNNPQVLKFNLAHSRDSIVYGFTKSIDVGVDVEFINKEFVIDDLVQHCCSKQEQNKLITLSDEQKYSYFYNLWVIKEALVKAMGLGLSYDLREIHINFSENKLISAIDVVNNCKLYWTQDTFVSYNGYCSAFALGEQIKAVSFFAYNSSN